MKERPIPFSAPMVPPVLDGSKTQTRRVVKPQFNDDAEPAEMGLTNDQGHQISGHSGLWWDDCAGNSDAAIRSPYGQTGDRLWVRETWRGIVNIAPPGHYEYAVAHYIPDREYCRRVEYAASQAPDGEPWRPSIHMPRWASRILLEITGVRVERLQDISEADAIAEGVKPLQDAGAVFAPAKSAYCDLWEAINGSGSWFTNPWVWVIEFKVIKP